MKVPIGTVIYLSFGGRIKIPVNPEEINITYPSNNQTFEVLDTGEIVVPMPPGLTEVQFESFFPADMDDPYTIGGGSPGSIVRALTNAKKRKRKGRLIISRSELFDTNLRCIIEEFSTTDKGGEPGDIYYSIMLKEFRSYGAQSVTIVQPAPATEAVTAAVASTAEAIKAQATTTTERPVETPVLRVGAQVIANGEYCYDSYGSTPHGTANNLQTTVTRIANGNPYPVHIGSYGWLQESQLQITG